MSLPPSLPRPLLAPWLRRLTAAACLLGAETIHVLAMEQNFSQWLAAGVFFLVVAVLEGAMAVTLIVGASRRLEQLCIGLNLATVAVWVVSRTVGLPLGPLAGAAEPVGRADLVATVLELVTVATLLVRAGESNGADERPRGLLGSLLVVALVAGVTAIGVAPMPQQKVDRSPVSRASCASQPPRGATCRPTTQVAPADHLIPPGTGGELAGQGPAGGTAAGSPPR